MAHAAIHLCKCTILHALQVYAKTRTKSYIRYAKENDREKRERRRERDVRDIESESERERHRALPYRMCTLVENLQEISQAEK